MPPKALILNIMIMRLFTLALHENDKSYLIHRRDLPINLADFASELERLALPDYTLEEPRGRKARREKVRLTILPAPGKIEDLLQFPSWERVVESRWYRKKRNSCTWSHETASLCPQAILPVSPKWKFSHLHRICTWEWISPRYQNRCAVRGQGQLMKGRNMEC